MAAAERPAIWWVRRDFRLSDNPALRAAVDEGGPVLPLFVLDPVLLRSPGKGRGPWMRASLAALDADLRSLGSPGLTVVQGKPSIEVPRIARHWSISAPTSLRMAGAETRRWRLLSPVTGWS